RIQFINLPVQCQIKIYTLAGDFVFSIDHDDANKGYEDWNLTSNVGQAVASGIYLYSVEDKINGKVQIGKFVIIK
ncbi:MAG: T9SS type A sorting domain-containing protein, partial [Chloroflexota bacterium]